MKFISTDPAVKKLTLTNPVHFLALGFGSGLAAKAPGTFGTLAAVPIVYLMSFLSLSAFIFITLISCLVGIYICDKAAKDMGVHDHGAIVWDEVAGLMITMIAAPAGVIWLVVGFALFRFFDILKPWPIRWLDAKVHGGFGIMIDDVLAGIFSLICLQLLAYYI
ncbi:MULTISPECIES: phosphatidylglycerophosphatase A [unclassified Shewanella]|uniref:phosphatidylglycerophosphatase A family protein n=1 Tax=unclassified Shewanella TaxID=196818 RepID=UPI000C8392EC|nr:MULTISPECIES: phosphatidylglycerophosphatase A [unclassified Shewanella]MDO6620441.1 phosphatidylglycerophosphatase A [Shewanella sp. 6_MG-2023]MDO6640104.1 phosphatidylglycerophosphatase A [Shewanella sp. 5_MG-2023]MDO6679720.1 phosphatidylglycerophosphatase A [Shewanella sp. 4_MG-2023]MDO6774960.1 phosphatidylglycerophosphatase A [Shewanella sp. 3_MG-2023]PMG26998.1 phosphatidylglycerophosphatase [Shewanella sp. 10N.286.52.C2]